MTKSENIKVLSTISIPEEWLEKFQMISPNLDFSVFEVSKAADIPDNTWSDVEVLFTYNILPQPEQAPQLRWVQVRRPTIEHIQGSPLLTSDNIRFTSISGVCAPPAAEYIMMALLSVGHQFPDNLKVQRKGEWDPKSIRQAKPLELHGSTVGIVGYGSVGRELARLLQPYDVQILASKLDAMDPEDRGYTIEGKGDPEGIFFHRLYPPQAIRSMLRECDFVVVTVPLTNRTSGMLNKETLDALKTGAVLVNICDSQIISLDDLANAMTEKKLRGALLDSFEDAPPPQEHAIWKHQNVIISPRIAWRSDESVERVMTLFGDNLKRYLNGASLLNRYDSERGY